ncbi:MULTISPECIES: hypothetical protein [Bacillus]|uniref:hypothetical protein n=1 Tax=Bacillus TaxID=1386 RepID=UPI002E2176FC|nr:hypothetical protein [Bacillus mobilis]HDR7922458.1 hypothetical protein [Bacillus paranthracis]
MEKTMIAERLKEVLDANDDKCVMIKNGLLYYSIDDVEVDENSGLILINVSLDK